MSTSPVSKLYAALDSYAAKSPFTWVYGLARSVLAVGTLINLLFNSPAVLFDRDTFGNQSLSLTFQKLNIFFVLGYDNLSYSYAIAIVVLLLVIAGVYPRLTGILHWLVSFGFFSAATIIEGGDQLTAILTLLLVPVTLLDPRTNHWQAPPSQPGQAYRNFTARVLLDLVKLQMAVLYLHAGIDKLYKLDEWRNGTALYYFFNDPLFGHPAWLSFLLDKPLANAYVVSSLTWGTIVFELGLFGALFMGRARRYLFWPAVIFHLGIAVVIGLVSFSLAMTGGLVLYMLPQQLPRPAWRLRLRPAIPASAKPLVLATA